MSENAGRICASSIVALSLAVSIAYAGEIRVACYSDGNECEVTQDLAKRFEAQNADVKVAVDKVPFKAIVEQLPVQLAAGEGPDIARVTELGGLSVLPRHYALREGREILGDELRRRCPGAADGGRQGYLRNDDAAHRHRAVNKTLFGRRMSRCPVRRRRGPMADARARWRRRRRCPSRSRSIVAAIASRAGISMGAKYFDAKGNSSSRRLPGDGEKLYDWNRDGTMPKEVWGGVGGASYRDAFRSRQRPRRNVPLRQLADPPMDTRIGKN
jgi:alpha-1,4-digalacturonate transport system substrate-binding protein